ncbi:hypothetical protein QC762_121445 [Podospora pseudocomata]|uniref:Uncharacterized protein n=1 Tax=Podospora pseudocomata TaxID=2093779 RepID=A0ABR0GY42_9PEZI|nr:hypothetical protein QC762_121445 [Podospora pseudocomata]
MKFWALVALAASVAAIPFEGGTIHKRAGGRIHIGYRIVSKEEADAINANGGKAVQSRGTMGRQLGTGTYISPAFHDFPDFDPSKGYPWDCAVTVDATAWAGLRKAWIPKMFEFPEDKEKNPDKCKPLALWTPRWVANRKRFLKYLDPTSTPENTVLFSVVLGHEEKRQALIPPAIIDSVDVYLAQCAERAPDSVSNAQIGQLGTVDWGVEDMKGWGLGVEG